MEWWEWLVWGVRGTAVTVEGLGEEERRGHRSHTNSLNEEKVSHDQSCDSTVAYSTAAHKDHTLRAVREQETEMKTPSGYLYTGYIRIRTYFRTSMVVS